MKQKGEAGQEPLEGRSLRHCWTLNTGKSPSLHKNEQPVGENSPGRWLEQQGIVHSLFSTRRSRHHSWALHLPAFSREQLHYPIRKHFPVCSSWLPHGRLCTCFPFTASLVAALDFMVSRNHLLNVVLKPAYTWEFVQVQQIPRWMWLKCLCIADKVVAPLILSLLHVQLLCTRGVVVAGVNSATTGRMWCIYTFGVCYCPCNHLVTHSCSGFLQELLGHSQPH